MSTKIFLAHASEDKLLVRQLHGYLADNGFEPWLDEIDLLPGQNWQDEIQKAIRKSDVFIACFSMHSVTKTGYVQKEFRSALVVHAEKPPDSIYFIPLKLNDCELPNFQLPQLGINLRDIQWVDYWKPDGPTRLINAIKLLNRVSEKAIGQKGDSIPGQQDFELFEKAEEIAAQWYKAFQNQDFYTLILLSGTPFFTDDGKDDVLLLSDEDIRERFRLPGLSNSQIRFNHLRATRVSDWKTLNIITGREKLFSAIRVLDSDIIVMGRIKLDFTSKFFKFENLPEIFRTISFKFLIRANSKGLKVRGYWVVPAFHSFVGTRY